jgi:hypothetical protein
VSGLAENIRVLDAEPVSTSAVIEKLEEALEQARSGQLSSVAIAVVYRDGCTGRSWSPPPSRSCLIGAVARLQHGLIEAAEA